MRRRIRFAAPFVIVTSCGQPAPVEEPIPVVIEGLDHVKHAELARGDAGVEPLHFPIDASADLLSTSGAPLVVTIVVPAYTEQAKGYISCHNFGPRNRGCNPPRPRHHPEERHSRRIVAFAAQGEDVLITVETQPTDKLERGMTVRARTRSDVSRVGYVDDISPTETRLVVALSEAEVRDGAHIDIVADETRAAAVVTARILAVSVVGSDTLVTIGAGRRQGIEKGWRVEVVRSGRVVPGGDGLIESVTESAARVRVKLTPDQIRAGSLQVRVRPR